MQVWREKNNYDQFICHGDVVNYGPWSDDCVKLLNTIEDSILLKGNHEIYFLSGIYNGSNIIAKTFFNYCYDKFTQFELIKEYIDILDKYKIPLLLSTHAPFFSDKELLMKDL